MPSCAERPIDFSWRQESLAGNAVECRCAGLEAAAAVLAAHAVDRGAKGLAPLLDVGDRGAAERRRVTKLEAPTPSSRMASFSCERACCRARQEAASKMASSLLTARSTVSAAADGVEVAKAHFHADRARAEALCPQLRAHALAEAANDGAQARRVGDVMREGTFAADRFRGTRAGRRASVDRHGSGPQARGRAGRGRPGASRRGMAATWPRVETPSRTSLRSSAGPSIGSVRSGIGARNAASPPSGTSQTPSGLAWSDATLATMLGRCDAHRGGDPQAHRARGGG